MKCVKHNRTGEIYRVTNQEAEKLVNQKEAIYISKEIWKINGRKYKNNLNVVERIAILDTGIFSNCMHEMQSTTQ